MSREGALWIGGLEPYMDETFLMNSFNLMGEENVISIKVFKNNFATSPVSYGFVNFSSDQHALMAMHKLNGKVIPNTNPPARYKLNHSSTRANPADNELAIWVGDLSPEVHDYEMYTFFLNRFKSTRSAKVVLTPNGESRGYGFVRFSSAEDQTTALTTMNGAMGLGCNPIRINHAQSKSSMGGGMMPGAMVNRQPHSYGAAPYHQPQQQVVGPHVPSTTAAAAGGAVSGADPNAMAYQAQWQQYYAQVAAWNDHYAKQGGQYYGAGAAAYPQQMMAGAAYPAAAYGGAMAQQAQVASVAGTGQVLGTGVAPTSAAPSTVTPALPTDEWGVSQSLFGCSGEKMTKNDGNASDLIDHCSREGVDSLNAKYMKRTNDLFDAIEESRWQTVL